MTRVDGLIILDTNGKPLITSHFPQHPPSYPFVHIDAYNHALKQAQASSSSSRPDIPPVLWIDTLSRAAMGTAGAVGTGGAGLCHVQKEGLKFLVPLGQEVNPLFGFAVLDSFLVTLREYLGDVTEATIKENFDIVYMWQFGCTIHSNTHQTQLIEEMLDEGHPTTMETSMLKEIVLPPTLVRKLLSAAGVSGLQNQTSAPFSAPIPWRKQHVRHANNEIYFDIEESLDAIVDRKGNVLSSALTGRIDCNSRLSGNPDLLLSLSNPKALDNCSFHPCIRFTKWERDHVLSFIPPDGRFRLLDYRATPLSTPHLPLHLKPAISVEEYGGKFSLTLTSRTNHRPIEDIVISIYLGHGAASVSATATGDKRVAFAGGQKKDETPEGGVGGGTWEFDPHTHVLRWKLASLVATERPPSLTGSFTSTTRHPIISPSLDVAFTLQNHSFTGLRVDQLKVTGDVVYKPFKGVRVIGRAGKMEVRW